MMFVGQNFFSRYAAWGIGAIALLICTGYAIRHTPVLLHVFAETDCACGDYHADVTGLILRNPFRNHSPELSAAKFLAELRAGHCVTDLCRETMEHRVSDWKLAYRRDRSDRVLLYYRLTKYGTTEPAYALTGEGMVEVAREQSGWRVVNYSSYF